ncbi:MAG: VOC family protein [Actinomycetota bacterium]|nr:MAG: VOC family protein [Actinomycetota bacterium]
MQVKELGHAVLFVRDVAASAYFYREVLGFRQVMPAAGEPIEFGAMFSGGRTHHELFLIGVGDGATPIPAGRRIGLYHLGFKVGDTDDELREALADLQAAGVELVGASDHDVTHSLYLHDPDGNEIELYVDVPGADWDDIARLGARPKPLRL